MPSIEVVPEQLLGAGSRQSGMAGELREAGLRLRAMRESAAGGAGEAGAARSMADCCETWSRSLVALADAVEAYGANLTAAASAYGDTDAGAMPSAGHGIGS